MEKAELLNRMETGEFASTNGKIMRVLMMIQHEYKELKSIKYAIAGVTSSEMCSSVSFLADAGYIHVRDIASRQPATVADHDFEDLEIIASHTGIRLMSGYINDPLVTV